MNDQKKPFVPPDEPIRDDVIGKRFASCAMRSCPEPHVIRKYGVGGVANVSIYTCRRCKYRIEQKNFFGLGCSYGLGESVSAGTKG